MQGLRSTEMGIHNASTRFETARVLEVLGRREFRLGLFMVAALGREFLDNPTQLHLVVCCKLFKLVVWALVSFCQDDGG
jgi:hypothetical protein